MTAAPCIGEMAGTDSGAWFAHEDLLFSIAVDRRLSYLALFMDEVSTTALTSASSATESE